ncbi:MAG: site-specific DNA-methyltransferase [Acutalibacteraceae bacterium]|nr:site-specific DNA-methyltransferase [Acutalibacteraceae bacterium]
MDTLNTIINTDAISFLSTLSDGCVDCVITDPPYKQEAHDRGFIAKHSEIYKEMADWTNSNNDWYNEAFLNELVRVCRFPNVYLFCGKRDLVHILNYAERRSYFYHIIPVCKKAPAPFVNNTWLSNEYSVHFTDRKIVYNKEYQLKIPYFLIQGGKTTSHPNEKNLEMVKRIVSNITQEGQTVLDCFMGSGTTAVACRDLNRNYIGCELNPDFIEIANARLKEEKQLEMF